MTYKFPCPLGWYLGFNKPEPMVDVERLNPGGFPMEYRFADGATESVFKIVTTTHLSGDPEETQGQGQRI